MSEIKPGDVVVLKSGGPKMTVTSVQENRAECSWFSKDDHKSHVFYAVSLSVHEDKKPTVKPGGLKKKSEWLNR